MADVAFHHYSQSSALEKFLPRLQEQLPHSDPIYNRLRAPHNTPERHCVFAATTPDGVTQWPDNYSALFADRSRHHESQVWMFNALTTRSGPLRDDMRALIDAHVSAAVTFIRSLNIPEAPGWPFDPVIRFACLVDELGEAMLRFAGSYGAVARMSNWQYWAIDCRTIAQDALPNLPNAYTVARVPEDQLDIVLSTSSIPRQRSTMLALPNVGLLDASGKLVSWAYVGIGGGLATLHTIPEHRGKGLAVATARHLLSALSRGDFSEMGFDGATGWAHADVADYNNASLGVLQRLGGRRIGTSHYIGLDTEKLPRAH